jgi:hypothetical protein
VEENLLILYTNNNERGKDGRKLLSCGIIAAYIPSTIRLELTSSFYLLQVKEEHKLYSILPLHHEAPKSDS